MTTLTYEWVQNLLRKVRVGQVVEVEGLRGWGVVRYVGPLQDQPQTFYGVELQERCGTCDGEIEGKRYFQTKDRYAIFVKRDRIVISCERWLSIFGEAEAKIRERLQNRGKRKIPRDKALALLRKILKPHQLDQFAEAFVANNWTDPSLFPYIPDEELQKMGLNEDEIARFRDAFPYEVPEFFGDSAKGTAKGKNKRDPKYGSSLSGTGKEKKNPKDKNTFGYAYGDDSSSTRSSRNSVASADGSGHPDQQKSHSSKRFPRVGKKNASQSDVIADHDKNLIIKGLLACFANYIEDLSLTSILGLLDSTTTSLLMATSWKMQRKLVREAKDEFKAIMKEKQDPGNNQDAYWKKEIEEGVNKGMAEARRTIRMLEEQMNTLNEIQREEIDSMEAEIDELTKQLGDALAKVNALEQERDDRAAELQSQRAEWEQKEIEWNKQMQESKEEFDDRKDESEDAVGLPRMDTGITEIDFEEELDKALDKIADLEKQLVHEREQFMLKEAELEAASSQKEVSESVGVLLDSALSKTESLEAQLKDQQTAFNLKKEEWKEKEAEYLEKQEKDQKALEALETVAKEMDAKFKMQEQELASLVQKQALDNKVMEEKESEIDRLMARLKTQEAEIDKLLSKQEDDKKALQEKEEEHEKLMDKLKDREKKLTLLQASSRESITLGSMSRDSVEVGSMENQTPLVEDGDGPLPQTSEPKSSSKEEYIATEENKEDEVQTEDAEVEEPITTEVQERKMLEDLLDQAEQVIDAMENRSKENEAVQGSEEKEEEKNDAEIEEEAKGEKKGEVQEEEVKMENEAEMKVEEEEVKVEEESKVEEVKAEEDANVEEEVEEKVEEVEKTEEAAVEEVVEPAEEADSKKEESNMAKDDNAKSTGAGAEESNQEGLLGILNELEMMEEEEPWKIDDQEVEGEEGSTKSVDDASPNDDSSKPSQSAARSDDSSGQPSSLDGLASRIAEIEKSMISLRG